MRRPRGWVTITGSIIEEAFSALFAASVGARS
jgi:hypothetical protein